MKIEYDDICVKKKKILNKNSFVLSDNGVFLLRGANGTGKTLLLNYLHYKTNINSILVSQFDDVIPELSILENITMSDDEDIKNKTKKFLDDNDLGYILNLNPKNVSGGEKRLITFLRSVFSNKDVVLLDEPSNDLDYMIADKVIEIISQFSSSRLFIISTHDDRFDCIKNGVLKIKEKNVFVEIHNERVCNQDILPLCDDDRDNECNKIIHKMWSNSILYVLTTIILIFLSFYLSSKLSILDQYQNDVINENQVNLFLEISETGLDLYTMGAMPLEYLEMLYDTSLWQFKDFTQDTSHLIGDSKILNDNFYLKNTNQYTVYPLEFFEPHERRWIFTIDVYLERTYGRNDDLYVKLPNEIYIPNYDESGEEVIYNQEIFDESVEWIQDKYPDAYPVFYSIYLKENDSYDNFIMEGLKDINTDYVMIYSQISTELVNQMIHINHYKSMFKDMFIYIVCMFIVQIGYLCLYTKSKTKNMRTLFNYGFNQTLVEKEIIICNSKKLLRVVMLVVIIVISFIHMLISEEVIIGKYLLPMSIIAYLYIGYLVEKIVLKIILIYLRKWNYRG